MGTIEQKLEACMTQAEPQPQHAWLERLVGEWTYEVYAMTATGEQGSEAMRGTETVRSIGGLWVVAEGQGEMPDGGEAKMVMSLGYDPHRGRFVGTWFGSMMTHLWVYDGELDADDRVLTLYADGPSVEGLAEPPKFKDVIEITGDNERTLTGHLLTDDGSWQQLMAAHYRRRT